MTEAPVCIFDVLCVCRFLGAMSKIRKATFIVAMPFMTIFWNNTDPTGRVFMKFYITEFFEDLSTEDKVHYNMPRIMSTSLDDWYTFAIGSRWILLRMRKLSYKFVQKIKPHDLRLINFLRNRVVCVIMWKITLSRQATARFAFWIIKVTHARARTRARKHTHTPTQTHTQNI
jgi:hypothetical protein